MPPPGAALAYLRSVARAALPAFSVLSVLAVLGIGVAAHELGRAHERAQEATADAAARAFASRLPPETLTRPDELGEALAALRRSHPAVRTAGVHSADGRALGASGRSLGPADAVALEALRRRSPTFAPQRGAEPARIGLPLNAGGDVRAVLALALDFAPAGAALDQARRAVALAGVLGALLGTLVLALWTAGRPSRGAPLVEEEEAAPPAPEPPVEAEQSPFAVWDAEPATSEDLGPDDLDDLDDELVAAEAFPHDDPLTGLLTEHGFVEELREELVRAQVDGYRVTVCALEIDRTHGFHPVRGGSAHIDALRLVATRLTSELDAGELCARRGERFLLALGRMGGTRADDLLERLQAAVGALVFVPAGHALTMSAGTASFPYDGTEPDELLDFAGEALASSQAAGGDRSTAWVEAEEPLPTALDPEV